MVIFFFAKSATPPYLSVLDAASLITDKLAHFWLIAIPGMRGFRNIGEKSKSWHQVWNKPASRFLLAAPGLVEAYPTSGDRNRAPNPAHFGYILKWKNAISVDAKFSTPRTPQNAQKMVWTCFLGLIWPGNQLSYVGNTYSVKLTRLGQCKNLEKSAFKMAYY